jgi:glycosyltransferase involved in cell wall biosynthesis
MDTPPVGKPTETARVPDTGAAQIADWSVAVFAHNVADTITDCLDSIRAQDTGQAFPVFVLVNGSSDATESLVRAYAATYRSVVPVTLSLADKANAWNHYMHVAKPHAAVHFFVDGDMRVVPGSFAALSRALSLDAQANAVGALPATGRTRSAWSQRMVTLGRLAGCLYALRGSYVAELRHRQIRIPTGLIGEDLFLSCVVKERLSLQGLMEPSPRLIFSPGAGFAFRPLSPARPKDWWTYGRRLVRYQIRDYQLGLLMQYLQTHPRAGLPPDLPSLYRQLSGLPRYRWRGRMTPIDVLAVRQLRRAIRNSATPA